MKRIVLILAVMLLSFMSMATAQLVDKPFEPVSLSRWDLMTQQREVLGFDDCIELCVAGLHMAGHAALEEGSAYFLQYVGMDREKADLVGRVLSLGFALGLEGSAFWHAEDVVRNGQVVVSAGAIRTDAVMDLVERQMYAIQDVAYDRWGWPGRVAVGALWGAAYIRTLPHRDLRP